MTIAIWYASPSCSEPLCQMTMFGIVSSAHQSAVGSEPRLPKFSAA